MILNEDKLIEITFGYHPIQDGYLDGQSKFEITTEYAKDGQSYLFAHVREEDLIKYADDFYSTLGGLMNAGYIEPYFYAITLGMALEEEIQKAQIEGEQFARSIRFDESGHYAGELADVDMEVLATIIECLIMVLAREENDEDFSSKLFIILVTIGIRIAKAISSIKSLESQFNNV
ncbi:MAG: hypothetical protein QXU32_01755 [Nitrososphaerales archaeon]